MIGQIGTLSGATGSCPRWRFARSGNTDDEAAGDPSNRPDKQEVAVLQGVVGQAEKYARGSFSSSSLLLNQCALSYDDDYNGLMMAGWPARHGGWQWPRLCCVVLLVARVALLSPRRGTAAAPPVFVFSGARWTLIPTF